MPLLIRKIEEQKWRQNDILHGAEVSADAITGCLRTYQNTLSLWKVESEEEINDAVLAIVSFFDKADTIDIVKIDPALLEEKSLKYEPSIGKTAYTYFENRHFDLIELSYKKLGFVADVIVSCLRNNKNQRFYRKEIKNLIREGLDTGKIDKKDLKPKLIEDLKLL
ncbi:MAG: hypothetical protein LBU28_01755 [Spirochaetaceae bacterium]|jgi:hypothetical protein|nr:hypothetical protein [Spirochaetaceae bacterium]